MGSESVELDPFTAGIAKSIGMVLEPDVQPVADTETVGERLARLAKSAGNGQPGGEAEKQGTAANDNNKANQTASRQSAAENAGQNPAKTEDSAAKAAQKQDANRQDAAGKPDDGVMDPVEPGFEAEVDGVPTAESKSALQGQAAEDANVLAGLTEEQRDEYEFARYCERVMPDRYKGMAEKTLDYFKKVDEWGKANPDATDEDFEEFVSSIKPQWDQAERRRLERRMVADQTEARIRAEMEERLRQLEAKPVVEREAEKFRQKLLEGKAVDAGEPIPQAVAIAVREFLEHPSKEAYTELARKYPAHVPALVSTSRAADALLRITNGVEPYNPQNRTHVWLANFLAAQGAILERAPEHLRIRNGREFLSRHKLMALLEANPKEAEKYWTFDDRQVLEMLAVNASKQIARKREELREAVKLMEGEAVAVAGAAKPATSHPPAKADAEAPAPKAGAIIAPGQAAATKPVDADIGRFFSKLFPGAEKVIGA